jgi:ATP-binding cassette, subfamily B, heavy metal transporter
MKREKRKVDFKYNFKTYFGFVKKYKKGYIFTFLLVLILASMSLGEKYLFKVIIDNGTNYSTGLIALDAFSKIMLGVALTYCILLLGRAGGNWLQIHLVNLIEVKMIYDLKTKFFNHILSLSQGFHSSHKTGSLISKLTRGSRAIERISDFLFFEFASVFFQVIVISITMFYFDKISSIVIFLTALAFIGFGIFMSWIQQGPNLEANDAEDIEKANIADIFMNVDSVKYYGKEDLVKERYRKLAEDTKIKLFKTWGYGRWFAFGQYIILGTGTFFLIYFPIKDFLEGRISLGTITFIYAAYLNLLGPLYGFVHSIRNVYQAMADFQALFEYDKIKNDIIDKPNAKELHIKEGEVDIENVKFKYLDRNVIDDVSLKIKPGEKVAFVGHSGSGKTTLVKLIYRLYDVNHGKILIDGHNVNDLKQESLRSELSVVPQECILFDDSIYNNIAFSRPQATREEIMAAIKFAQLDGFISRLPNKENTIVGERGVKLSGGEKQRVSIARAILANKKILILDEATSSLDSKTEHEIQKDLQRLMKGRTSIIIAHRLSTIMNADRIVVMDRGKIVQIGKHSQLIKKKGSYQELWNLQKGGYLDESD